MATIASRGFHTILAKNLPWTVGTNELMKFASQYGPIHKAKVMFNRNTGLSKRFGFIETKDQETQRALLNIENPMIDGKTIQLKYGWDTGENKVVMAAMETNELEETFSRATNHIQSLVGELDTGQLLGFYGLYKQATVGKCETQRPNWYQTRAKHKWDAWKNLGDMSRETAMENYVRAVSKLDPTWQQNSKVGSRSWISVSTMPNMEDELRDSEKTLLDWVKEGNETKVCEILSKDDTGLNDMDENGMMPIHWAADRGQLGTLKLLVQAGASINAQDENGQTALHYAASCCHVDVVQYLFSLGAETLQDNEGMTPKDVADQQLVSMFSNTSAS